MIFHSEQNSDVSATAMVVPCMTTMASNFGGKDQKGTVMGVYRSLGALARALGPILASIGKKENILLIYLDNLLKNVEADFI